MLKHRFRTFVLNEYKFLQSRLSNKKYDVPVGSDQFTAHSPLYHSRFRSQEKRSKIFFEHPPVPNRYAKYFFLFCFCAITTTGFRDRVLRKFKEYVREEEMKMYRFILPFVQAMEDIRYTALEQRNYMIYKSVLDSINPVYFENVRWRYYNDDIFVPDGKLHSGKRFPVAPVNQNMQNTFRGHYSTAYDKGLFDNRELGYIY